MIESSHQLVNQTFVVQSLTPNSEDWVHVRGFLSSKEATAVMTLLWETDPKVKYRLIDVRTYTRVISEPGAARTPSSRP